MDVLARDAFALVTLTRRPMRITVDIQGVQPYYYISPSFDVHVSMFTCRSCTRAHAHAPSERPPCARLSTPDS